MAPKSAASIAQEACSCSHGLDVIVTIALSKQWCQVDQQGDVSAGLRWCWFGLLYYLYWNSFASKVLSSGGVGFLHFQHWQCGFEIFKLMIIIIIDGAQVLPPGHAVGVTGGCRKFRWGLRLRQFETVPNPTTIFEPEMNLKSNLTFFDRRYHWHVLTLALGWQGDFCGRCPRSRSFGVPGTCQGLPDPWQKISSFFNLSLQAAVFRLGSRRPQLYRFDKP